MQPTPALTLSEDDPRVVAARAAEQRLFDYYGLRATTHFVRLPHLGLRVRVSEIGTGRPVLVVPGNTGEAFALAPLLAELKGRRILALNRPGGGLSEGMDHRAVDLRTFAVETLTGVLDAFGLERAPLLAHSIGGHMSLWLALDRPERVSALSLLGVPGNLVSTRPPLALRLLSVPLLNRLLLSLIIPKSAQHALGGLAFVGHTPQTLARLPRAMAECYYTFQQLPHYRVSSLSLMESSNRVWPARRPAMRLSAAELGRVRQPAQFLWGTQDPFGSAETGRAIAGLLPAAQFHAIAGGGHLPWLDDPAGCGRLVREFLENF